jgi:type IV secretion system protein VirB9
MPKKLLTGILWAVLAHAHVRAQEANAPPPVPDPTPVANLGGSNLTLNAQQAAGVSITQQWEDKSLEAMDAAPGQDGAVMFAYGKAMPQIVCAVFQVTDIELEPGEVINDKTFVGDPNRWSIQPAVSGDPDDPQRIEHVIVKPKEIGLDTTLVIPTTRRTYHLRLISHDTKFMAHVTFTYPDGPAPKAVPMPQVAQDPPAPKVPKAAVALQEPSLRHKKKVHLEASGKEAVGPRRQEEEDLYRISGNAPWRPLSVYHDGTKTYIELPPGRQETPVLFALKKGGLFGWGYTKAQCNFRVHGNWMVADTVLDKATLTAGVGSSKQEIKIERLQAPR